MSSIAFVLAMTAGLSGCGAKSQSTHIEQGQAVTTGIETYDSFFREVTEVKGEAEKIGAELTETTRPLQDAIGAQSKNAPAEVVRAEAKKLQMSGTLLHLDLLPEAKVVASGKPDAPVEKLLGAAEQAAKGSLAVARRASEVLVRIADLERRRADLVATTATSFPDADKRGQVSRELTAAGDLLAAAREVSEKHGGAASKLALDLAMAMETGAGSSAVAAKKPTGKPGGGGKPGGAAPARPKGDDFDK